MPRPDFPKTLAEFHARFRDETACRTYLAVSRWPEGYRCPRCQHPEVYEIVGGLLSLHGNFQRSGGESGRPGKSGFTPLARNMP